MCNLGKSKKISQFKNVYKLFFFKEQKEQQRKANEQSQPSVGFVNDSSLDISRNSSGTSFHVILI